MKTNYSETRREQIEGLNKGKQFSLETIEAIRESALSRKIVNYTKQGILNMKKKSRPIIVKELNNTVYGEFNSIVKTAKVLNCSTKTIQRTFKSPSKLLKGLALAHELLIIVKNVIINIIVIVLLVINFMQFMEKNKI